MAFITRILDWLRQLVGLVLPVFSHAGDLRRIPAAVKVVLHLILVAAILAGLWYLHTAVDLDRVLRTSNPVLRRFWAPLLFLLTYAFCWLGWWLWKLLTADPEASHFPDIDAAWDEAVRDLGRSGISLADAPLFLVLGRAAGEEDALFRAAQLSLTVKQAPARGSAPVYVRANRDAIYVACAGASLTGRYASLLAGDGDGGGGSGPAFDANVSMGDKSIGLPQEQQGEIKAILAKASAEGRPLSDDEKEKLRRLASQGQQQGRGKPMLYKNQEEVALHSARLRHLCRLIVRDRRPFCPANGVLVVIPWAATDTPETADEVALLVQRDLATLREGLRLRCPLFALWGDLEQLSGYAEFRKGFPQEQLHRRLGQRLPLAPDVEPAQVADLLDGGARWVGRVLFPTWIYKMLRLESETAAKVTPANRNLYQMLRQIYDRFPRLGRVLARGFAPGDDGPPLFGGCYVGGTGPGETGQAFVAGVFKRLIENQSYVSWTPEALAEDAAYHRRTTLGYLALGLALTALAAGGWWAATHG